MAELTRSLIARQYFGQFHSVWKLFLYSSLNNDSPIRIRGGMMFADRGVIYLHLDQRTKLYKWIFKHYDGTKKAII